MTVSLVAIKSHTFLVSNPCIKCMSKAVWFKIVEILIQFLSVVILVVAAVVVIDTLSEINQ